MNKLLLVISATFLFNSATAQAAVETFNFTFSVESYSNTARATGFISFDTTNYYKLDNFNDALPQEYIVDFGLPISGTDS
jgi:hypothetical protein